MMIRGATVKTRVILITRNLSDMRLKALAFSRAVAIVTGRKKTQNHTLKKDGKMDPELFGFLTKGGPYALVIALLIYTRLEFNRLQRERDNCKAECDDRLRNGDRKFDAIMELLSEIKTSIAFMQGKSAGKDELSKQIADAINDLRKSSSTQNVVLPRP